jgi:hypothetical protein
LKIFFMLKDCFLSAESKSVWIFEISLPVSELQGNIFQIFLTVRLTVCNFLDQKLVFFTTIFIEIEQDKLASFCFFLWKLRSMPFMLRRFYTGIDILIKTSYSPKVAFQKPLLGQRRVQKGALHNFGRVKNGNFENCT